MSFKSFWTFAFFFIFFNFLAVHYAHMKTPGQDRYVASQQSWSSKPWYDASWKY